MTDGVAGVADVAGEGTPNANPSRPEKSAKNYSQSITYFTFSGTTQHNFINEIPK